MRATLLVTAIVFLLPVAPASAAELVIAETVSPSGDPGLTAAVWPREDAGQIEWRRCAGGGTVCEPLSDSVYARTLPNGRVAFPGETPAGTVFEAVATINGVETKARTRTWQGRLASAAAPALQGEAAVGKPVTTLAGSWSGGWGVSPAAHSSVFACREPVGVGCWLIAHGGSVVPEPRWAGWYLFAQESFATGDAACNSILGCHVTAALAAPPFAYTPQRTATIALSTAFGPIAAPAQAVAVVVAAPTASIRSLALRRQGRLHVGRVRCETPCFVQLKVSGGNRRAVHRTLHITGTKALTVPARRGKLKIRVVVDGKLVTSGSSTAR